MRRSISGFTIVELLIVIVVIAILAAISMVAYTSIQERARVSAIVSEAKQWRDLFVAYKAVNGSYPSPVASGDPLTSGGPGDLALNYYCLGTGFPEVGGTGYCYRVSSTNSWRVTESTGAYLISQLSTIAEPPANSRKYVMSVVGASHVGPYLVYIGANNMRVSSVFPSGTDCSSMSMQAGASNQGRQNCYYVLD